MKAKVENKDEKSYDMFDHSNFFWRIVAIDILSKETSSQDWQVCIAGPYMFILWISFAVKEYAHFK